MRVVYGSADTHAMPRAHASQEAPSSRKNRIAGHGGSRPRSKSNRHDDVVLFLTDGYPAPYPEDTQITKRLLSLINRGRQNTWGGRHVSAP